MLTLYYVSATFLQAWRLQKVCNKIAEQLAQHASIAFYALQPGNDDGFDTSFATSELCVNRGAAKVTDILWLHGQQRGCCMRPVQKVLITSWISFPNTLCWLPFARNEATVIVPGDTQIDSTALQLSTDVKQRLQLLLEAQIEPSQRDMVQQNNEREVHLEDYGKLIAWKIDSHLAVLIETDIEHFTKLLIMSFLRDNLFINDQLPLLRIESVQHEGTPQPFEGLAKHLRRNTRKSSALSAEAWQKHLEDLRALSVLAQQAMEFESNKNRADPKVGIVKPDLIPHEQKGAKDTEPVTEQCKEGKAPIKVNENPTEIQKPVAAVSTNAPVTDGRFKTTKVTDAVTTATAIDVDVTSLTGHQSKDSSSLTATPSELEKLAAATVRKEKSPVRASTSSVSTSKISTIESIAATTPSKSIVTASTNSSYNSSKAATTIAASQQTSSVGISTSADNAQRPTLRRNKDSLNESKPLNILVYSDSASARESTIDTLRELLAHDTYTIYAITPQQAEQKYWLDQTALLVVCGTVAAPIGEILVDYFLHGGKVLSLCSDILHFILPNYRTAEVREHELVQFSYDKWHKVKMMHHIFCYQPSPVKKHFSTDSEESNHSRKPALVCPRSIELKDLTGQAHKLDVKILGTEETWNTPSLLLANSIQSGGKAVFSQVHLETNPSEFESDEMKFNILKQNERTRLEIFSDLLSKYLDVEVHSNAIATGKNSMGVVYQNAYFLGRHESKFELLEKLKAKTAGADNVISTRRLIIKFCSKNDKPLKANNNVLPILIHSCPDDFSTVDYFDNLKTTDIGRLVIYAPVVNSSMNVINDLELTHGIVVLPRQQTEGVGRSNNQWLSPPGCAMFSIQLHITLDSPLGKRLPLIQHIIGTAMVNTLKGHELYKTLDIGLKWPNDIYANGLSKVGGLIVNTTLLAHRVIINIGCALNLDNEKPTICINELINDYNSRNQQKLPLLKYEQIVALIFNEIERLLKQIQADDFDSFYELYYRHWLHNEQTIKICIKPDQQDDAKVIGIDDYGYLLVRLSNGSIESVQPDGNSFDMLKGLIVPKYF